MCVCVYIHIYVMHACMCRHKYKKDFSLGPRTFPAMAFWPGLPYQAWIPSYGLVTLITGSAPVGTSYQASWNYTMLCPGLGKALDFIFSSSTLIHYEHEQGGNFLVSSCLTSLWPSIKLCGVFINRISTIQQLWATMSNGSLLCCGREVL